MKKILIPIKNLLSFLFFKINQFTASIKSIVSQHQAGNKFFFKIVEVNIKNQYVILTIKGRAMSMKLSLAQLATDGNIVQQLSPVDACILGYYYGKLLHSACEGSHSFKNPINSTGYLNIQDKSLYQIHFQNREGKIGYINNKTQQLYVESPALIMRNKNVIMNIHPCQASLIGIEAGIQAERQAKHYNNHKDNVIHFQDFNHKLA